MPISSQGEKFSAAVSTVVITILSLNICQPEHSAINCSSSKITSTLGTVASASTKSLAQTTVWKNVAVAGMGFVTGLVSHPHEPDLIYARTDVGGIYRWDGSTSSWVQLLDQEHDRYSIESIALDPNNPNVIYAATGAYTRNSDGEVLKSADRGKTWAATNLITPAGTRVRMGGNEEWRWIGERLAVDPNNSQVIYFGSRLDGLYRSTNGTKSWQAVKSFSDKGTKGGIAFVVFDRRSGKSAQPSPKKSQTLYVGVMGGGVYRSTNGGTNWVHLTGSPDASPQQAALTAEGTLYTTFFATGENTRGGVWKYEGDRWFEITPSSNKNYSAISIDAHNPKQLLVATYPLSPEGLYRSTDGGRQWQQIKLRVETPSWWPNWHLYTLMGSLVLDPHHLNRAWLTNGFGVLRTDDITANPSDWSACMANLEELVTFVVKSPPLSGGAPLLSGVADMDGFRHESLTSIPTQTYDRGKFGDTTGIDFSETNPNIVVRVGSSPGKGGREDSQGRSAYSTNNGRTWTPFGNTPSGAVNGKVAVSATLQANGYPIINWAPQGDVYPQRSLDGGKTWLPVKGAPNRTTLQLWFANQPIASDRVDGNLFYLYKYSDTSNQGAFYRSTDGGASWQKTVTRLPDSYLHSVKAVPKMQGEVWLSIHKNHLYRSSDAGLTFTPLAQVQTADEVAFGKAAPGRHNPTVFVYGTINSIKGLFRSDDATSLPGDAAQAKWIKISTDQQKLGSMTFLEGDRSFFGRVYVGTGGRGILYGEPNMETKFDTEDE